MTYGAADCRSTLLAMPAVDPRYMEVFERAYAHRQQTGDWPTMEDLQRQLASERIDVIVREVANQARNYVSINAPDDQVKLSLRALALLPAATPLLDAWARAVRTMISRYPDRSTAARYGEEVLRLLGLDPDMEAEVGRLLRDDGWAFGSSKEAAEGSWSFEISDRIMAAADAQSVEEIIAARFDDPLARSPPAPEPITGAPGGSLAIDPDQPISRPQDDLLDRTPLARALAVQAISQPQGHGFVMGVSGPWGSGKTSLLNLMADAIVEDSSGYVVRFDPWMFSSSEELVTRFLRELSAQMVRERKLVEVASRIADYAQILAPLTVVAPAPWLAPVVAASRRATGWWRRKKTIVSAERQRDMVRDALTTLDRGLVVLIDDVDRLQAQELRDIVRLVKLVGDFPNTTYVLAYDQQRVARALGDTAQEGHEFLEKIVQLSHDVPPTPHGALDRVPAGAINAAVGDLHAYRFDQDAYTHLFVGGVRDLFSTVRDVPPLHQSAPSHPGAGQGRDRARGRPGARSAASPHTSELRADHRQQGGAHLDPLRSERAGRRSRRRRPTAARGDRASGGRLRE
jgi:type II secretory pathway predicted ATPase ExeA